MTIVKVTEQDPTNTSIFCTIEVSNEYHDTVNYGGTYFVCNLQREIIQFPRWFYSEQKVVSKIRKLGYKF